MSSSSARRTAGIPGALTEETFSVSRDPASERRLSKVVERYFSVVWRALRRFGVPESAADDAAQQVLLTFAARMASVEVARERAFLASTAVRVAANVRRKSERAREVPIDEVESGLAGEATPDALLEEKQRRLVLDEALGALPFEQRTVFVLFELEGFTLPEIAESLEIPLGTATSRLRRARHRFEAWVASHDSKGDEP
jgi:RNA polymerase sigma-70 factor (ECF subfamily)